MSKTRIAERTTASATPQPWHSLEPATALTHFATAPDGLSPAEAADRLARHGPNRLAPPKRRGPLVRFLLHFNNVLIYVLLIAATVTALLGHWIDSSVIFGVALANSVIGFIQEGKAERALDAIREMLSPHAVVRRGGRRCEIAAEQLVPGDIVLLASGDKVPADLRLIEARSLRIEEAALTGESEPAAKQTDAVPEAAVIGDRACMAYSGTLVTFGQATGVVVATGDATEIGRISQLMATVETLATPLTRKLGEFARWVTGAILAFAGLTFAFGVAVRDYSWPEMFLAAVSLAVAAIPEGLPAILTVTLAIGVQRMAARHAIIRRLPAVETLGSVTVICSDKTGTLTRNEMTVRHVVTRECAYAVEGAGYAPHGALLADGVEIDPAARPDLMLLARAALLCNDELPNCTPNRMPSHTPAVGSAWTLEGDPTEGALLALARKAGLDVKFESQALPRADVIPFESEHRFMATLHHDHAGHALAFVKGAPERLLAMCDREQCGAGIRPLQAEFWNSAIEGLAAEGERVLALAYREFAPHTRELDFADVEQGLVLLGLTGIIDPPRPEAIAAVERCRSAGVRVKMITGDHAGTAAAIGRQLGIGGEAPPVTGSEIEQLDDQALRELVRRVDVFARSSPEHKLRLVQALQANGEVVAMTGDGVNDAPALKRADVGIAMGVKGTAAAKEAAEMVLADDNFASIGHAVEEGRTVYDNLKKSVMFFLPINGGESGALIAAVLLGAVLPITPLQILWVNMVSSVALALALAFEPTEPNVMRRPPRPVAEPILSGFLLWRVALVAALFVAGIFGMFELALARGATLEEARTIAVNTLVAMEVFYLFSVRYLVSPAFTIEGVKGTPVVLLAVGVVVILQSLFTWAPVMHGLFDTRPLAVTEIAATIAVGLLVLVLLELEKAAQSVGQARKALACRTIPTVAGQSYCIQNKGKPMQKKTLGTALILSAVSLPFIAEARPGYTYLDLSYVSADLDNGPTVDGFGIDGSIRISNEIHLVADYQSLSKNDVDLDLVLIGRAITCG
jgi:magnesium-transporting ATPase (P-type)